MLNNIPKQPHVAATGGLSLGWMTPSSRSFTTGEVAVRARDPERRKVFLFDALRHYCVIIYQLMYMRSSLDVKTTH